MIALCYTRVLHTMVLSMARPRKHPRTGIYWFRMRVPDDVRPVVQRKEITRTLRTRDSVEAAGAHRRLAEPIYTGLRMFLGSRHAQGHL